MIRTLRRLRGRPRADLVRRPPGSCRGGRPGPGTVRLRGRASAALLALVLLAPAAPAWGAPAVPRAVPPAPAAAPSEEPLAAPAPSRPDLARRAPRRDRSAPVLLAGASRVPITPYTRPGDPNSNDDPEWDGGITATGIWGEPYADLNGNGRYDVGEPFVDDPENTLLDPSSAGKWDGIYLAGFGHDRVATGVYDPIWVRTLVLRTPRLTLAWVVLDVIGYYAHRLPAIRAELARRAPGLRVDHILLTHTHNHEGPDTVGLWGPNPLVDGKYPKYLRYIDRKIAQSIALAARQLRPARIRYGAVDPRTYPDLEGLQARNGCRTPWFFDDELRVMQVVQARGPGAGETIATVINWSTHVESMEDENTRITSDFVHSLRETVEAAVGGVALFVPGAQGAVEIVGDSCTRVWRRDTFDGETFPVHPETGRPLAFTIERTYAIGRVVGKAALHALRRGRWDPTATEIDFRWRDVYVPVTNQGLALLADLGVVDVPGYLNESVTTGLALGTDVKTTVYAWRLGQGSFVTAPGEMFPEIWYGLERHHRPDIAETHTGRPFEPAIRPVQPGAYRFFVGYTPDLLGYIVPGYDFYVYGLPVVTGFGIGAPLGEVPDPNADRPPDPRVPEARYTSHYHETNSASSMLAPAVACTAVELWGGDVRSEPACREWAEWKRLPLRLHDPLWKADDPRRFLPDPGDPRPPDPRRPFIRHY